MAILACLALIRTFAGCGSDADGNGANVTPNVDSDGGDGLDGSNQVPPGPDGSDDTDGATPEGPNPVATENNRPGTDEWLLGSPATNHEIEGYPSVTSVAPGGKIGIHVSTISAGYTIDVYRLGWYGGKGGRKVIDQVSRSGTLQTTPAPDADGLVECAWTNPYELQIADTWVSGYYLVKLTTTDTKKQAYVPFIVRDDKRVATYLVQSSVTTFQAYNNWGGKSLYDFNSTNGARATRVSFHRPYGMGLNPESAAGIGAGEIITNFQADAQSKPMGWELPMVRFLEREGFDVSYVTNVDVHQDATLVAKHPVFLSVGHDEYWSYAMRDHVEQARDHDKTNLAFFSGNESYWQIRFQPAKTGEPDTTIFCSKDAATDPISVGNDSHLTTVLFGDPLVSRSEEGIGGVSFEDFGINAALVVDHPTSWVFAGTGLTAGAALPGLLGYEVDGIKKTPLAGVRRVMHSPWSTVQPSSGMADATTRQLPSGAETFSIGSIQFAWGLDAFRPAGVTQANVMHDGAVTIAKNVLTRFAKERPARNLSGLILDEKFDAALDVDRWTKRTVNEGSNAFDPLVPVDVAGGRVTISPRANIAGLRHGGLVTARTLPMTCGTAKVELVQATNGGSTADTTFAIAADSDNWYRFTLEAGMLYASTSDGAATGVAYDSVQHRWLRIRHDCTSDQIFFDTSPDGTTWTKRGQFTRLVDLHAAYIELEAGTYKSESAPGQAVFDNLRVDVTGVRSSFDDQRDPEYFTPEALHEGHYDPEMAVFPAGGRLHLRPRVGIAGQHHMGFATTRELDWTGGVASINIIQPPDPATEASVSFAIVSQAPGWARFAISAGKLFMQSELQGTTNGATPITYDPVAHKYLRLRHDVANDDIVWETSANGATWTERRRVDRPFPVSALRAEIEGGTYQSESEGNEALVDDFVFAH